MTIILLIPAVAFAALCVWLTVRIVNRRERWAKWTLAGVLGLPALYVASFGPACWFSSRTRIGNFNLPTVYRPILSAMSRGSNVTKVFSWYAQAGAQTGWMWVDMSDSAGPTWVWLQTTSGTMVP